MKLVTVFKTFNAAEAQLIHSRLDAADIPATVTHEEVALSMGYGSATGGVLVQVPEDRAEEAKALLEAKDDPRA